MQNAASVDYPANMYDLMNLGDGEFYQVQLRRVMGTAIVEELRETGFATDAVISTLNELRAWRYEDLLEAADAGDSLEDAKQIIREHDAFVAWILDQVAEGVTAA